MASTGSTTQIDIEEILSDGHVPALPQSAISILELAQDSDNGPAEFAIPIEADPGLTGQVLKFVNSSYFGFSREISSIKLAITLVGVRTMKNFVLWSAVFSLMPNPRCGPFELRALWQDSLRRGLFARAVAKLLSYPEAEECFAGALLQDMAVPILAGEFPAEYTELLERRDNGSTSLSELEEERFGWNHAEVAGRMARSWNLPDELGNLIAQHGSFEELLEGSDPAANALAVSLSSFIPPVVDEGWYDLPRLIEGYDKLLPGGDTSLEELLEQVDASFEEFAPILKIASPAQSLVDRFHAAQEG